MNKSLLLFTLGLLMMGKGLVGQEQADILIRGGRVVTFMGAGKEAVVDAAAEYRVNGEWRLLVPRLPGGTIITVI